MLMVIVNVVVPPTPVEAGENALVTLADWTVTLAFAVFLLPAPSTVVSAFAPRVFVRVPVVAVSGAVTCTVRVQVFKAGGAALAGITPPENEIFVAVLPVKLPPHEVVSEPETMVNGAGKLSVKVLTV